MNILTNILYGSLAIGVLSSFSQQIFSLPIIFFSLIGLVVIHGIKGLIKLFQKAYSQALLNIGMGLFILSSMLVFWDNNNYIITYLFSLALILLSYLISVKKSNTMFSVVSMLFVILNGVLLYLALNSSVFSLVTLWIAILITFIFSIGTITIKYFKINPLYNKIKSINFSGVNLLSIVFIAFALNQVEVFPDLNRAKTSPSISELKAMNKEDRKFIEAQQDTSHIIIDKILEH